MISPKQEAQPVSMASKASDRCLSAPLLPARPAALLTKAERSQEQRFAGSGHPFVTGNCISKGEHMRAVSNSWHLL